MTSSIEQAIEKIKHQLPDFLDKDRLNHTLRVADTAKQLALHWSVSESKAYLAGLGHDIAKQMTPDTLNALNVFLPSNIHALHNEFAKIWHAFVGPYVVSHLFGVKDLSVLNAMRWHTTGRPNMGMLDKIIFVSDYIEPGRNWGDQHYLEDISRKDLDLAVSVIISRTIQNLLEKRVIIHPYSFQCYNFYLQYL